MGYQRQFERRVRIGVVGLGSHSYRNILPALTYLPVDLVAVCDVDGDLARLTARQYGDVPAYTDAAAMYAAEQLDAVLLCVSPQLHPPLAAQAFAAGLHVWMEKPAGTSASAVQELLDARGDRVCVVGYKKAFQPATRKAVELLAQPAMSPLHSILAVYPMSIPQAGDDTADPTTGRPSKWLADGCHPLALLLELGGEVDSLAVHRSTAGGGALILNFASGAVGTFHLADGVPAFQPSERYTCYGSGASVTIENTSTVIYQRGIPFRYATGTTFAPEGTDSGAIVWQAQNTMNTLENKAEFLQGIVGSLQHFCDSVLSGTPATIGTLETAVRIGQIYEAALRSRGDVVPVGPSPLGRSPQHAPHAPAAQPTSDSATDRSSVTA
jgi:predicted dehydrogenase